MNKKIPYGRHCITEEDIAAVVEVLKSDYLTQGPVITEFEKEIAQYHNAEYAVAFSNGTAALHAAYHALDVKEGDEIISSPITFVASTNGAVYCGAKPVFADMDPDTTCIDINKIEEKINSRTKVITPVAFAGYPVDLKRIREIADRHGCSVLYDAAHAIGSRYNGTFGMEYVDAAILSFHPVKHIAAGEGGMVLTNRKDVYEKLALFRTHGITKDPARLIKNDGPWYYEMQSLGYNYRITDMQCALALSQFKRLKENIKSRNRLAQRYKEALQDIKQIILPPDIGFEYCTNEKCDNIHSYHLFTICISDKNERKRFVEYMHENGILVQIHYIPVHLQPYYKETYGYKLGDCPAAEEFYEREVSLPMYHTLTDEDQDYVIEKIREFWV